MFLILSKRKIHSNILTPLQNLWILISGRSSRPLWDSDTQRSETAFGESSVRRPSPFRPLSTFDYDPMPYLPSTYQAQPTGGVKKKEGESYKEISRRLDCKLFS